MKEIDLPEDIGVPIPSLGLGEVDPDAIGEKALALMVNYLDGKVTLTPAKLKALQELFRKLVPGVRVRESKEKVIGPDEYVAKAMKENLDSLERLASRAALYTEQALERYKRIYPQIT